MGTYYKIVNLTKQEVIDMPYLTNIKYGSMCSFSLQFAVLSCLLGFNYNRSGCDLGEFVGRWA